MRAVRGRGLAEHRLGVCLAVMLAGCGARSSLDRPDLGRVGVMDAGPDAAVCRPFRSIAGTAGLDLFLLIDSSNSMGERVEQGFSKATLVGDALIEFLTAEASDGLGVSLTFFPNVRVPSASACMRDTECEPGVPCAFPRFCDLPPRGSCVESADCTNPRAICRREGWCEDTGRECDPEFGVTCPGGAVCLGEGQCEQDVGRLQCLDERYREPFTPFGILPAAAPALARDIRGRATAGGTPTPPALEGVVTQAVDRLRTQPGRRAVVLLATDGVPRGCGLGLSEALDATAEVARAGAESGVRTFVVGVFAARAEAGARRNLQVIAEAGGSGEAVVVTADGRLTVRLLELLNGLREELSRCTFAIPDPNALPDARSLQVRLLGADGAREPLERRASLASCGPGELAYAFDVNVDDDVDPSERPRPGVVELCPAACDRVDAGLARLELEAVCP